MQWLLKVSDNGKDKNDKISELSANNVMITFTINLIYWIKFIVNVIISMYGLIIPLDYIL